MNLTLCKFCMKQVDILVQSSRLFFFWLRTKNCDLWAGANFLSLRRVLCFLLSFLFSIYEPITFEEYKRFAEVASVGVEQNDCGLWRR